MNGAKPGRLERRILGALLEVLARERAVEIADDIEEAFRKRSEHHGFIWLRVWFWAQVWAFFFWCVLTRLQRSHRNPYSTSGRRRETMRGTWNDLRFALRSFRRAPGFTTAVILTLALGVGANTAIFTVVDAILWQPLEIPDADRVVGVCERGGSESSDFCGASPPNMTDYARTATSLEGFGIARTRTLLRAEETGVTMVSSGIGTPGFLTTLGARPMLGRLFDEGDLPPNDRHVIVLSHEYWTSTFGSDSSLVGRTVVFDEQPYRVIGVLAPDVDLPLLGWVRLWAPLPWDPADEANRGWRGFWSVARLRDGVGFDEAQAEMATIADRLANAYPEADGGHTVQLVPLRKQLVDGVRSQLMVFLGASALVLLIACVNVANLLLTRAGDRQTEFAVRAALGAGRGRLTRQLLTESVALATVGGVAGFWLGHLAVRWFVTLAPPGIPRIDEIGLDAAVTGFGAAVLVGTAVVFGLTPAWRATRVDLTGAIKGGGQRTVTGRTVGRDALAVSEIALAGMLLIGAGLLIRSFATANRWDPGFDPDNLGVVWLLGSTTKYSQGRDVVETFHRVAEEIRALPQVRSASTASAGPLFGGYEPAEFTVAGREDPGPGQRPRLRWFDVGHDYFSTMGIPVLRGRSFTPVDDQSAPAVAVINEAAARVLFAGEDPLGQHIVDADYAATAAEVIGIVRDVRPVDPMGAADPEVYWPNRQRPRWATFLVIRSTTNPDRLFETVRSRVAEVDASMSVGRTTTMVAAMEGQLVRPRFQMLLIAVFAMVAVALAAIGTYGVISYGVSQRTHEFGLRMSLGADRQDIVRLVLGRGTRLGGLGLATGLIGALAISRVMSSMLVGVTPRDPMTFVSVAALLGGIVMLASSVPAMRAARTDPMTAIRTE